MFSGWIKSAGRQAERTETLDSKVNLKITLTARYSELFRHYRRMLVMSVRTTFNRRLFNAASTAKAIYYIPKPKGIWFCEDSEIF